MQAMSKKRFTAEQIIPKLRETEVDQAKGRTVAQACKDRRDRADLLPLAEGIRWSADGLGQEVQRAGEGEHSAQKVIGRSRAGEGHSQRGSIGKLISPAKRHRTVEYVRNALVRDKISERRACRVLGQPRSIQHRKPYVPDDEPRLVNQMVELATQYGRYGYRMVTGLLREDGWKVNHKRIERLWRREGLKVPQKQPKRRRLWLGDGSCVRPTPIMSGATTSCRTGRRTVLSFEC